MLVLRTLRYFAEALVSEGSPKEMALAAALGLVVGLVPKGNLIAVALMVLLCAVRVNLAVGMTTAFLFSWIGVLLDPLTHRIGHWLLTIEALQPFWIALYDRPLMPWTGFDNTVVTGSLLLGLLLFYPTYRLSRPQFERHAPRLQRRLKRFKVVQLLWGVEIAGVVGVE